MSSLHFGAPSLMWIAQSVIWRNGTPGSISQLGCFHFYPAKKTLDSISICKLDQQFWNALLIKNMFLQHICQHSLQHVSETSNQAAQPTNQPTKLKKTNQETKKTEPFNSRWITGIIQNSCSESLLTSTMGWDVPCFVGPWRPLFGQTDDPNSRSPQKTNSNIPTITAVGKIWLELISLFWAGGGFWGQLLCFQSITAPTKTPRFWDRFKVDRGNSQGEIFELTNSLLWPDFFWCFRCFSWFLFGVIQIQNWSCLVWSKKAIYMVLWVLVTTRLVIFLTNHWVFFRWSQTILAWLNLGEDPLSKDRRVSFKSWLSRQGRRCKRCCCCNSGTAGQRQVLRIDCWNPSSTSLCPY